MAQETDVKAEDVAQAESQIAQEQLPESDSQEATQKDEKVNWQKTREVMEEQKRQLDLMKERERRYQEELLKLAKSKEQVPEDDDLQLSKDDLLTVGQWEKLTEKTLKKFFQKQEDTSAEGKLRHEYNDYDSIVTPENLERLARENPEAVETLQATPRLYAKAKTAYHMLKSMYGSSNVQENKEKLAANLAKPRPAASLGSNGALSQAHAFEKGLTPELKKQLLQEMIDAKKR